MLLLIVLAYENVRKFGLNPFLPSNKDLTMPFQLNFLHIVYFKGLSTALPKKTRKNHEKFQDMLSNSDNHKIIKFSIALCIGSVYNRFTYTANKHLKSMRGAESKKETRNSVNSTDDNSS
jgi:hypothetical protein